MPSYAYTHGCDTNIPPRTVGNNTPSPNPVPYSPTDTLLNFGAIGEVKAEDPDNESISSDTATAGLDILSSPIPDAIQSAIDSSFHYVFHIFADMDEASRAVYFSYMRHPFLLINPAYRYCLLKFGNSFY
ncbi:hypothetical protein V8E36_006739 [Tilletia maclaganii]